MALHTTANGGSLCKVPAKSPSLWQTCSTSLSRDANTIFTLGASAVFNYKPSSGNQIREVTMTVNSFSLRTAHDPAVVTGSACAY